MLAAQWALPYFLDLVCSRPRAVLIDRFVRRVVDGRIEGMAQRPDYSNTTLCVVTLREAVCARPAMYFGDWPAADWPLVMCAWTVHELLAYSAEAPKRVDVTLGIDGVLAAAVDQARLTWPTRAKKTTVEEIVGRRMWWAQLGHSNTVTIQQAGRTPGPPKQVGDLLIWDGLRITTRMDLDPEMFGVPADSMWLDAAPRLGQIFTTDRFRLPTDSQVMITNDGVGIVLSHPKLWPGLMMPDSALRSRAAVSRSGARRSRAPTAGRG
ncbi:hypothetical protein AB0H43_26230 [Hamadaea sp. NPDC050747]|uniref:hypothetical protein n=1 Tax=Hamadaea sp. NPDC050747 TaxID=3155789 RepID=UPI003408C776